MDEFRELFRYGTWANLALIDHCKTLPPEALGAATAGTFGPIVDTYAHMLEQERWGLWVLRRRVPEFDESSLDSIRATFERHGELWQDVLDSFDELSRLELPTKEQWEQPVKGFPQMYAMQTLHHQELHRTQIRSVLGSSGYLPEEKDSTDVWAYWAHRGLL